jgi:hypothetical protein
MLHSAHTSPRAELRWPRNASSDSCMPSQACVGFAKNAMTADLHMSNDAYALGAGIFFAAYAIVGVPANLLMNRIGPSSGWAARRCCGG